MCSRIFLNTHYFQWNARRVVYIFCFTVNEDFLNSWFQTFAVIWILYIFFWVFPRRQIVVGRRFGTMYQFHLQRLGEQNPAFEDGTDTGFRNVGQLQFDAGEIPRRKYTISWTVWHSSIRDVINLNLDWDIGCSEFFLWIHQSLGKCKVNFAVRLRSHLKTFPFIIHSSVGAV